MDGAIHWHPDLEIATAAKNVLDYQVGQQHIILEAGDSIFINGMYCTESVSHPATVPTPFLSLSFPARP